MLGAFYVIFPVLLFLLLLYLAHLAARFVRACERIARSMEHLAFSRPGQKPFGTPEP